MGPQLWHIRDKREAGKRAVGRILGEIFRQVLGPAVGGSRRPADSEIFNQLVPSIEAILKRGGVMRSIDRVSGSFLVVLFGGVALLCGSLLFATLG
jgi:hypothetical protein